MNWHGVVNCINTYWSEIRITRNRDGTYKMLTYYQLFAENVCIHDFDDAKEESNKTVTFASRLIQDCFNKQSLASRFL